MRQHIGKEGLTINKKEKNFVALIKIDGLSHEHIMRGIEKCLDSIEFDLPDNNSLMLKPNMHYYFHPSTGSITNPDTVSALIDVLRKRNNNLDFTIVESDASAMLTKHSFKILGYERIARNKKVGLLNMSGGEIIKKRVIVRNKELIIPVTRKVLESNLLINIPTLKAHRLTTISCCLKNIFGAISKRFKHSYHVTHALNDAIVAANKVLKSSLCIVDGTYGFGKFPVKNKILLMGTDPVATDSIAAKCMGYNPEKIKHLRLAAEEQVGSMFDVETLGEFVPEDMSKEFPRINPLLMNVSWKAQLLAYNIYRKLTDDVIPPPLEE